LAKRGISYLPREDLLEAADAGISSNAYQRRLLSGYPTEGTALRELSDAGYPQDMQESSRAASGWENMADEALASRSAGEFLGQTQTEYPNARPANKSILEQNPWLATIDPQTPVYGVGVDNLGFSHLLDELAAATYDNADLPANLRLTPDKLEKVTMPQAVELVSKINAYRAEEALRAERESMLANLKATPRGVDPTMNLSFVEKPGATWVDIPDTTEKDAANFCTTIGKQAGWCTANESTARGYGSGENRLLVMLDGDGRPHVQVQLVQGRPSHDQVLAEFDTAQAALDAETPGWYSRMSADETYRVVYNKAQQLASENAPQNIKELKPPQNTFNSDQAREYAKRDPQYRGKISESVLNFLNQGNWGYVRDLDNYDIVDMHPEFGNWRNKVHRSGDMTQLVADNPDLPRFMPEKEFYGLMREIDDSYAEGGVVDAVKVQVPYAEGGAVQAEFDPSAIDEIVNKFYEEENG
jgi:hypothetical protein